MNNLCSYPQRLCRRWTGKAAVLLLLTLFTASARAQLRVEYFFDSDPGRGRATTVAATVGTDGTLNFDAPTAGLTPGFHLLGVRAYNVVGTADVRYAPTITQQVFVPADMSGEVISRVEYFWDADPGFGHGTPLSITPGKTVALAQSAIPTTGLTAGLHRLGLRAFGSRGWGSTLWQDIAVPAAASSVLRAEYFWDNDPGFGHGTSLSITPGQEVSLNALGISAEQLDNGPHQLFIRYQGTHGWSPTLCNDIVVTKEMKVLNAEYFWNDDPGFGQGTPIAITPGEEVRIEDFGVPSYTVHGDAVLYIRYRGTCGWSPTVSQLVMVDAEGRYTLNAQAETSMEQRNYQSLGDAFADFTDRGIGNNIELEVKTTNTVYELDATDETIARQVQQTADNLTSLSTPREQKTLSFIAAAGSGNTVSITAQSMQQVMPLLAQVYTENVTLLINGTEYSFNALTRRQQAVCPAAQTEPVDLSTIGTGIAATFTAQPHTATVLSGFATEATDILPAMTIKNIGQQTDSVAYAVSLTLDGQPLYDYTYYIYARASMANQTFSGLTPAAGSSLDPGSVTLEWNALKEAEGYRLTVTDVTNVDAPVTVLDGSAVKTTSHSLTVESGHRYTWQVVAVGPCDELASPLINIEGRLLPDLAVTAITLPEGAQAGNQLTVTATIKNQGEGATIEQPWTDRLYYVIDGTDFAKAVQIAELKHTDNLAAGDSYEAVFTMRVPAVESGTMHVFVETDVAAKVMESDDTNNRMLSATAANLAPFYMQAADLAALRQLYSDFNGGSWNGTRWNTASELILDTNWSGVTFDTDGHVTAINLQGRGLTGSLSIAAPYVGTLSQLTSLNLSRNALTGDPAQFLSRADEKLKTVDLSYNHIGELSAPLPATITSLSLGYQNRKYNSYTVFPGFDHVATAMIDIAPELTATIPTLATYNHAKQNFSNHPQITVWKHNASNGLSRAYGKLNWSATNECYVFTISSYNIEVEPDETVHLRFNEGAMSESSWPAKMQMILGDANLTGFVDVTDVQATLNHIIKGNFNLSLWAANTWNTDAIINIQDIVSTVNIVLANQGDAANARAAHFEADRRSAAEPGEVSLFYTDGRNILVDAREEMAAFTLELEGARADQVRLLLNRNDWQMQTLDTPTGVRLLVFSPTGQTLPTGQTQLLRLSADAQPVSASASTPNAKPLPVATTGTITGITAVPDGSAARAGITYDLNGRRVATTMEEWLRLPAGIYIKNGRKEVKK